MYYRFINGIYLQSINVLPREVCGLNEFFATGLKRLPVNVFPLDVKEYVDVTPESDLPGMNGIGTESFLNGINELHGLGTKLAQEHTLS